MSADLAGQAVHPDRVVRGAGEQLFVNDDIFLWAQLSAPALAVDAGASEFERELAQSLTRPSVRGGTLSHNHRNG